MTAATKVKSGGAKSGGAKSGAAAKTDTGFVPKRGRPTKAQVAAIERSILSVAMTMFLEHGYASTPMETIAANAGVSKGTLYARYPFKADLFRAIVADRMATWNRARQPEIDSRDVGPGEYLMLVGRSFLDSLASPEVMAFDRLIRSEAARFPELAIELREQGYLKLIERLVGGITTASAGAGWPVADAQGVAVTFVSALLGWYREESQFGPIDEPRSTAFVARVVALVMGGRSAW